jgi:hypothetical protein
MVVRSRTARPVMVDRFNGSGAVRAWDVPSSEYSAMARKTSPSTSNTRARGAWHRRAARSATALSTGCTSLGDAEMTCKISLTAACCSNASARRCLNCRPVALRDFLVAVDLASTLAFAGLSPRPIGRPPLPLSGATTAQRSTIAYATVSFRGRSACSVAGAALHAPHRGAKQEPGLPGSGNDEFRAARMTAPGQQRH